MILTISMAGSSTGKKGKINRENKPNVHIIDFKYRSGQNSDSIRSSITNEFVKHFGNAIFSRDNETAAAASSKENDEKNNNKRKHEGNNVVTSHHLLNVNEFQEELLDISINKRYICILLRDGSVHRASCTLNIEKNSSDDVQNVRKFNSQYERKEEPFQVASDESFARSLQRNIDNLNDLQQGNILSGRRSYSSITAGRSRVPPAILVNNVPTSYSSFQNLPGSPSSSFGTQREYSNQLAPRLPSVASVGTYARYAPFPNVRQRRIQMEMGHLLSVSQPSPRAMIFPQTTESAEALDMQEGQSVPMGLFENITIVSLDNNNDPSNEFQINALPPNVSSPSELNDTIILPLENPIPVIENPVEQTRLHERPGPSSQTMGSHNERNYSNEPPSYKSTIDNLNSIIEPVESNPVSIRQPETNSNSKLNKNNEHSSARLSPLLHESSRSKSRKENNWSSQIGNLHESGLMGEKQFMKINAMESCFLLIDEEGHLWTWYNDVAKPTKATYEWNEKDPIIAIGCNMYRATLLLESNVYVTFYDKCFKDINGGKVPELVATLSHQPSKFNEIMDEQILDIQCSTFYTTVQTKSGKVFWWGLAPSPERNSTNSLIKSRSLESTEIAVGDLVAPKQEKNEMGCLVFNSKLHQFGIIKRKCVHEEDGVQQNLEKVVVACISRNVFEEAGEELLNSYAVEWGCKDVVFLEEQNASTGTVISFDGQYVIVKMKNTTNDHKGDLKVYLKTSLEKIVNDGYTKLGQTRYQKYLITAPVQVFSDPEFTVSAVAANEVGLSFLVNRVKDGKAYLVHPSSLGNDYSKWFTCGKNDINKGENIKSECTFTIDYEATPAEESRLCIKQLGPNTLKESNTLLDQVADGSFFDMSGINEDKFLTATSLSDLDMQLNQPEHTPKFLRSFSMPTGGKTDSQLKRKWKNTLNVRLNESSPKIKKPSLLSFGLAQNNTCVLLDNANCFYPIQFDCSLSNPPLLEIIPMKSLLLFDRGIHKDEQVLTILAVPKKSPLITALSDGDKSTIQKAVFQMDKSQEYLYEGEFDFPYSKRMKLNDEEKTAPISRRFSINQFLDERCNGNQNIMHVAASNILKTESKVPLLGNIMDIRNNEENAMLQCFLNCAAIWPKIRELLCERDSHGCTPFMTAIMMHNLRGADLILEAIKRDGRNELKIPTPVDKNLFQNAICQPAFSGLTPIHALIHCSSKKHSSQQWYSTLKVSNLPPSYSSRLLLKLFKSRYPSAYRAIMPIPEPQWHQRTVRKKLDEEKLDETNEPNISVAKGKAKMTPAQFQRQISGQRPMYPGSSGVPMYRSGSSRTFINRADMLRANAKEGLVMFGDINEMYQALSEMSNHSLLTKADHPSGALLSVVQHLLQVELYQEKHKSSNTPSPNQGGSTSAKPTYIVHPLASDMPFNMSNVQHLSQQKHGAVGTPGGSNTDISPQTREQTINKCFDDIMVHLLMTSLVTADPNILSSVNSEGDTAFAYFLNTYPRYSPSHLHKLFLNWRPCNQTSCKYNRHVGKITITSQKEIDPTKYHHHQSGSGEEKHSKTTTTDEDSKKPGASKQKITENPILARRGLQNRTSSLTLNVKGRGANTNDYMSSPITPSIRVIENLKFAPIEVQACSGLTPQIQQPMTAFDASTGTVNNDRQQMQQQQQQGPSSRKAPSNLSPFFPTNLPHPMSMMGADNMQRLQPLSSSLPTVPLPTASNIPNPSVATETCICHLNKARLLWNTTFQASVFYLAKSWPCIVSSVMCAQSKSNASELNFISCNKLDIFTENLLLNPYNVLLEVFVKTLQNKFIESKVSRNAILLPTLHRLNPIDQNHFSGKTFNGLLPWLTMHRFVRSLVRQLSLSLSKNPMPDGNLKLKIGRHANKNHLKRETRLKEHLSLCLRAFSWVSVIEILKAATAMLKPIRLGTVKAQPKGIIRDIHNIGQASSSRGNIHSGIRMHIPAGSNLSSQRLNVRYASRRNPVSSSTIPVNAVAMLVTRASSNGTPDTTVTTAGATANTSGLGGSSSSIAEDENISDTDETINIDESFHFNEDNEQNFERNETDINEIDWTQAQGITPDSSLAWALDGHIRMRNEVSSRLIPPTGLWQINQQGQIYQQIMNTPSVHAGYLYLSRMFCRLVKEATDIATYLHKTKRKTDSEASAGTFTMPPLVFSDEVENALRKEASEQLHSTWSWMKGILTTLEEQLNMGEDFDTKHFVLRLKKSAPEGEIAGIGRPSMTHIYGSTPDEYMMYLLKQDMGEASNSLPVLDLFSYTHLTYVLDAFLYMNKLDPFLLNPIQHTKEELRSSDFSAEPKDIKFFQSGIDLKLPITEEMVNQFRIHVDEKAALASQTFMWLDEAYLKKQKQKKDNMALNTGGENWNRVMDAFSTLFLSEGPGYERDSFLAIKAGASGRIARFQRTLTSIRGTDSARRTYAMAQENPALLINVVRSKLLDDCINFFTENMENHPFGSLRVRFEGEEGTGPGVNRGLFAAFASALKDGQKYKEWPVEFFAEYGNLPSQKGIFSPKIGKYYLQEPSNLYFEHPMSQEKRNSAFMAIGRFLGLTLWFNQTIPFILSRPVLMYLLGKEDEIGFDDLAFYDSALYKSYSALINDALSPDSTNEEFMDIYNFCFEETIEGHVEELIKDGRNIRVTKQNAIKYVRLCAHHKMVVCRENELQGLREGFHQMIPKELLENLEAEDLQLLLSGGVEDISLSRLRSIITFCNSRGCSRQSLERYKDWFWKIVMKMTSTERQKLLYFATGSSVLPALDNRVGNNEELSITVDIINSTNSSALPMSSTCGQRISMPLYPTKAILKSKLMQAIECQTYGLG